MMLRTCIIVGFMIGRSYAETSAADDGLLAESRSHFQPLPKNAWTEEFPLTPKCADLGQKRFLDARLSDDGTLDSWLRKPKK